MKKRFETIKSIQMLLFVLITVTALFVLLRDRLLFQLVGENASIRTLCLLLWVTLGLSLFFVLWDFNANATYKKTLRELDFAVYNDHVAGIANRYGCDAMIEKYLDKPLPANIGSIMFEITNLNDINTAFSHTQGNAAIQTFCDVLSAASLGLCFVGRNGGNRFLALFEECTEEKMSIFLNRVSERIAESNTAPGVPSVSYRYGIAFRESGITSITSLISLSDRRING